ncbi:MAG: DEAD/DEAH box helicase [Candidatus Marinimicrobia bacterium]|nr:DEAD/DEAH box helicase [Candidatus Neomarinimicrobiota bacterium]
MTLEEIIERLRNHLSFKASITATKLIPGNNGSYADFPDDLNRDLKEALIKRGIEKLYSHQAEAWRLIKEGKNVCIQTPTSSGKTLCYNMPVVNSIIEDSESRALYIFPTKALSQDQIFELNDIINKLGIDVYAQTFDGDTPQNIRQRIRQRGNIIVTNPDMLHQGILPHHTKWVKLFTNLKFIVIDELHIYRGVFGSHFTNVIRRLKRICRFYGSNPQFICCSATITNPKEHAENLTEEDFVLIDKSGAPTGDKYFIFYNPPIVNNELGIRANYLHQTRNLARIFIDNNISVIIFALSRLNVEILTKYLKDDFERGRSDKAGKEIIAGYRGGYLPYRRREIERGLKEGYIKCVIATNALELGIDIGSLDVSIIAGFPGYISSVWQQAGRSGRRGALSCAILVARSFPVDQFIINNPSYFFDRNPECARINPNNVMILVDHIKCASFELPFSGSETFGNISIENTKAILGMLNKSGEVVKQGDRWYWESEDYPASHINIRSISHENFVVVNRDECDKVIGEVDFYSVPTTIYPGAIYMVDGNQYFVEELDWEGKKAFVRESNADYFTMSIDYTHVRILDIYESKKFDSVILENGEVLVTNKAVGFKKIKFYTSENLGYGKINLPEQEMVTNALWFTLTRSFLDDLPYSKSENISGVLGLSYALHHAGSVLIMVDPKDMNRAIGDRNANWYVRSTPFSRGVYTMADESRPEMKISPEKIGKFEPTIFIFDNYPGGIGLSEDLYYKFDELVETTYKLIEECFCSSGCPVCVGPSEETGSRNTKFIAMEILKLLRSKVLLNR